MTDPHPNTTANAQEWAKAINAGDTYLPQEWTEAAADLITDLTENWVSIKAMQEWRRKHRGSISDNALKDFADLLPAAPTMDEIEWDDEHQGLEAVYQAGTKWESVVRMIYPMEHNGMDGIVCVEKSGRVFVPYPRDLTPLPGTQIDLTPTSPIENKPAPESAAPRPEDVPVGEPWQVEVNGRAAIGYRNDPTARLSWTVVSRDDGTGRHWVYDSDVTLIARLVPETTEQDDADQDTETVFDPTYTYRDKDGDTWEFLNHNWRCSDYRSEATNYLTPPAKYGPYTRVEA